MGSPPLVRERRQQTRPDKPGNGITPARAGKTVLVSPRRCRFEDHPRSCGKDCRASSTYRYDMGSPPLVRERLGTFSVHDGPDGITPARAGKTLSLKRSETMNEDHPRSCGKDLHTVIRRYNFPGSPPLVRERRLCLPSL